MVSQSGVQEAPVAAAAAVPVAHNPRSSRKRPERRGTPGLVGWSPRAHFAEGAGPWRWRGGRGPGDSQVLGEETSQAQHRVSGSRRERVTGRECFHVSRFSPDDDDPTPPPSWWNAPALTAERPPGSQFPLLAQLPTYCVTLGKWFYFFVPQCSHQ